MLYVKPYFYDKFICKAGECTDTCCAGWEITVDDKAMHYYKSDECPISEEIISGTEINGVGETVFRLKEEERCFFLCDNGLCRIYSECGKDALCDICSEHPRFYNFYNDCEEAGLGLCCEKVCELLFEDETPFYCIEEGSCSDDDYNYVAEIRDNCFDILENADSVSDAVKNLLAYVKGVSEYSDDASPCNSDNECLFTDITKLFLETAPINNEWTSLINQINSEVKEIYAISANIRLFDSEYRKLISYLIYRHFIESAYDYDVLDGVCFAVVCMIFVHMNNCLSYLNNGVVTKADLLNNVRIFSKQIEYSAENTEFIMNSSVSVLFDKVD